MSIEWLFSKKKKEKRKKRKENYLTSLTQNGACGVPQVISGSIVTLKFAFSFRSKWEGSLVHAKYFVLLFTVP